MYTLQPHFMKLAMGLLLISLSAITGISEAAPLYEQSPIDFINGYEADSSSPLLADNFTIAHSNLESISWWGAYLDINTDDFVVKLYSDLAGTGMLLQDFGSVSVGQTPLPPNLVSPAYYKYQFDLSTPLELLAGTYYLSIQNLGSSTWFWLTGNPGNGSFWNFIDTPAPPLHWSIARDDQDQVIPQDLAFRLEGSPIQNAPEPDIMMLMLLGGGMLATSFKLRLRRNSRVV